jgi:hypothetical protein
MDLESRIFFQRQISSYLSEDFDITTENKIINITVTTIIIPSPSSVGPNGLRIGAPTNTCRAK